jgi:hypothetical protein
MAEETQQINQNQQQEKKSWYKSCWGIGIMIIFWPIMVPILVWTKTNWHIAVKIIITVICLSFLSIGALTGESTPENKEMTENKELEQKKQLGEEQLEAKEQQKAEQEQEEVVVKKELTEEEKAELKNFYDTLMKEAELADQVYNDWAETIESGNITEAYLEADTLIKVTQEQKTKILDIEIPNIGITEEEKENLEKGITDISTGYYSKINGIEYMQDYLNTQDMENLSKAKKEFEMANGFMISGTAKIVGVLMERDIEISDKNQG